MNLYQLSNRMQQLFDQDELTEEECAEFDTLCVDAEQACIYRAKYIRNLQFEGAAVEAARKEMQQREKALAAKIEREENRLIARMWELKFSKLNTPEFVTSIKTNPPCINDYDKSIIPEKFWVTKVIETKTIDKVAIKEAIQSGEEVPGAYLVRKLRLEFK